METKDLTIIKQEVDNLLYENQTIEIKTVEDYAKGGDIRKIVQMKIKKIEEKRKEYTKPLDESKRRIMADFNALSAPLIEYFEKLSANMLAFHREYQRKKDEEQAKIEKEALKKAKKEGVLEVQVPIVNEVKTQRGDFTTTTVKEKWTFKLVDLEKVPREWLCLDEVKVGRAIRSEGVRKIPGLEIFDEGSLSGR